MHLQEVSQKVRRQLTLFLSENVEGIEKIRATFNPQQHDRIAAHVTLCREEEIEPLEQIRKNSKAIAIDKPICIKFGFVERFCEGKGVRIPGDGVNRDFYELRKKMLRGIEADPAKQIPHITLMHPRNSTCSDAIFDQIKTIDLPAELYFESISLIEQVNDGVWTILEQFPIVKGRTG